MLEEAGLLEGVYIGKSASHATRVAPLFLVLYSCLARQSSVVFFFPLWHLHTTLRERDKCGSPCIGCGISWFSLVMTSKSRTKMSHEPLTDLERCVVLVYLVCQTQRLLSVSWKSRQKPMGSFLIVCIIWSTFDILGESCQGTGRNLSQLATILLYYHFDLSIALLQLFLALFLDIDFFMKCRSVNCPKFWFWINNVGNWTNSSRTPFISTSMHHISTNHSQSTTDVDHNNYKIKSNLSSQKVVQNKVYDEVNWYKEFLCMCHVAPSLLLVQITLNHLTWDFFCVGQYLKMWSQSLQISCSCHVARLLSWLYLQYLNHAKPWSASCCLVYMFLDWFLFNKTT